MPPRRPPRTDADYTAYVKDFYKTIEDYDWNDVTDNMRGPEAILHRYREHRMISLLKRFAPDSPGLDVGCGTGLILRHLPTGSVGVDVNPRHLARAAIYAPQARVLEADAEHLPASLALFRLIVCTEVIEHLVHPRQALLSMQQHLTSDGVLIGSTPRRSLFWRFRFLSSTHFHNEPFHNEFTEKELRELFLDFDIVLLKKGFCRSMFFFVLKKKTAA
ncbi:class I SAM-dependent methyltransferase [Candidatus Peribacteria bacterium]|nr:MAG: class I SAM-dependent methyltransferase [Candidatus Peribacteria bacterium]